ncbi:probable CCR4-associated factor 1 homolog 11 [Macadamia integrifolia]|uniref:probable CCR4-associated factor 1 homolog 11 n=1 Tax=Macadamia integrifolia TaxID=60698 RepID=UPI001C4FE1D9|nr:probable CCR4-associated factor 1 homolog 11 [Macadamia integrifolia]
MEMKGSLLEQQKNKEVVIVDVWANNLEFEFHRMASAAPYFPFVSIDTEFPGVVFRSTAADKAKSTSRSMENYRVLKANVDSLHLIQLGITLTDYYGNLPDFGGSCGFVWQFNFKEFNVSSDPHSADSIDLLRQQGIDFEKNNKEGVDSTQFSELLCKSGLVVCNTFLFRWITFHGAYDFAYLLKVITRRQLPDDLSGFYNLLSLYFGTRVYDVKQMIKFCDGVFGGLERVAQTYGVERIGNAHCAGSDSLLTWGVFQKILQNTNGYAKGAGSLFGLDNDSKPVPLIRKMMPVPSLHLVGGFPSSI